jgi:transposase-like protein
MENVAMTEPKTLQEAILYFSNPDNCVAYLAKRRWTDGVVCPSCGSEKVTFNPNRRLWQCSAHHAKRQFSVKVGTVMEDSAIGLDKWLTAMWLVTNCKNGISSYEIARDLAVTQKTAWFMLHRIRLAMGDDNFGSKLGGNEAEVEIDETFVGGSTRNMHKERKTRIDVERSKTPNWKATNKNPYKTAVQGILDRNARQIRAKVIPNVKRETLQNEILNNVEYGSKLYTDAAYTYTYSQLAATYAHEMVNHAQEYVRGRVHTNGLENFWSLLKRNLHGTYHAVEPFHLGRYVDEQVFRFNNRATKDNPLNDSDRFDLIVHKIIGKRITFAELTGKVGAGTVN